MNMSNILTDRQSTTGIGFAERRDENESIEN